MDPNPHNGKPQVRPLHLRRAATLFAAAALASCGTETSTELPQRPVGPFEAVVNVKTIGDPARPEVIGVTNMPEGTVFMVSLSREEIGFAAGDKVSVSGGRFHHPAITKNGAALPPGAYDLSVGTPNAALQPPNVQEVVGKDYSNVAGPLVVDPYGYGPSVTFEGIHKVPGRMSPQELRQEQERRYREIQQWAEKSCADIVTPSIRQECLTETLRAARETMGMAGNGGGSE